MSLADSDVRPVYVQYKFEYVRRMGALTQKRRFTHNVGTRFRRKAVYFTREAANARHDGAKRSLRGFAAQAANTHLTNAGYDFPLRRAVHVQGLRDGCNKSML